MSKRVVIITPNIRPGGGPPGYVYNLSCGIRDLLLLGEAANSFEFVGRSFQSRNKTVSSRSTRVTLKDIVINTAIKLRLRDLLSTRIRRAKSAITRSEIVVIQGFQDDGLGMYAHKLNKTIVYMPHSPTIIADEYKMMQKMAGAEVTIERYSYLREMESFICKACDCIVFPSPGASTEYINAFSNELRGKRIEFIKSGVDMSSTKTSCRDRKEGGVITFAFVGRYVAHKGYDLFVSAANILGEKKRKYKFLTVGDGPGKTESPCVVDLGWRNDVHDILAEADIVVIPNRVAYYDLLPLECAALGKAMVMTPVGGNIDQIKDLPDVIASQGATAEELARAMEAAAFKLQANGEWGHRNAAAFEGEFTAARMAKRWDEFVSRI